MGSAVTWRGGNGSWSSPLGWSDLQVPTSADTVTLAAGGTVSVDPGVPASAASLTLAGGDLDVGAGAALSVGGLVLLESGTLALGGALYGGTLDLAGGTFDADGGTLDSTRIMGGLTDLGNVSITAATVLANTGPITPDGTLGLAGGLYEGARFVLDPASSPNAGGTAVLTVAQGSSVTFGATTVVDLSGDEPADTLNQAPVYRDAVGLVGAGAIVNLGTITSDFANATDGDMAISVAGFTNQGVMDFAPMSSLQSRTYYVDSGKFGSAMAVPLTWTQDSAPTLDVTSASFDNADMLSMEGGTLSVQGARFINSGSILLTDATTQAVLTGGGGPSVIDAPLTTQITFGADVIDFSNTGGISADRVVFDNSVSLSALGAISGALFIAGTLDLGGGTLDASAYSDVVITGTVENGAIATGGGRLTLDGATLATTSVAAGGSITTLGPITLLNPPAATTSVVLNATTTDLAFSAGRTVETLAVTAGDTSTTDTLRVLGDGTLTLGARFSLDASVANSTVALAGAGVVVNDGTFSVDAATLAVSATLGGDGVVSLADGAALTLAALTAGATPDIVFGAGPALLALPGAGAGVTLTSLHHGDLLDFTSISATPAQPGAAGHASIMGNTLELVGASGQTAAVMLDDPASGVTLNVTADPDGGTLVTVACFRVGTRIATPGGAMPVERLAVGDRVLTAAGVARPVKWLGRRAYAAAFVAANRQLRPVRFAAGALGDGLPRRALDVSPQHALLVDGVLVPAGALVNGRTITRVADDGDVAYVHIELDSHDLVLAEGVAAETFVPAAGRALFDNAAEYDALYPNEAPSEPVYRAPRLECGPEVERIRRALGGADAPSGAPRGHVERIADGFVEGWACGGAAGGLVLDMLIDGEPAGSVIANLYRFDLDRHGLPACGFRAEVPAGATVALRTRDGAPLTHA